MTEATEDKTIDVKPRYPVKKIVRNGCLVVFASIFGFIHYKYVSHLFENDRNFSHLSELEREMSFRTEMGFYYSYYKTVVQERPFIAGISKLMYDRLVEYPDDVNAFNRFNIHPEVIVAAVYRYLEPWLNTTTYRQCDMVHRGEGLAPVESCIGIGQPILFYLEAVWCLAGLMVATVFMHATLLSNTVAGGVVAVVQYLANHAECTRVQWAPNERENWAAPLFFLQTCLLTAQLRDRDRRTSFYLQISIFIINCLCLLFWQFTQFIFLTQTAIFFIMEQLRIIDIKTLCVFLHSHFCGLHMAVLLLQGNDMLKSSLYTSFFLVVSTYCLFFSSLRIKVQNRLDLFVEAWLVLLRICIVVCASVYLKKVVSDFFDVQEDSHVWDILYSKFTDYKSFHTLIYTCSDVFDFLPLSTVKNLCQTFLIPFVLLNCINVVVHWVTNSVNKVEKYYDNAKETKGDIEKEKAEKADNLKGEIDELDNKDEINKVELNKHEFLKDELNKDELNKDEIKNYDKDDTDDSGIENNTETEKIIKKKPRKDLDVISKDVKTKIDDKEEIIEDILICFCKHLRVDPAIFYNISQMMVFFVMAVLVMRLKLLFVTQMCVVSSLAVNTKFYSHPKSKLIPILWVICGAVLVKRGWDNMQHELSHIGEFTDIQQEELMEWISGETPATAAFAGSMPVLSAVMLSTRRAIVAHPHYEHREARERAYAVYKMYGRFSAQELYQELSKLKVTYLIVEKKYCYGRSAKGCSFENIWDIEAPSNIGRPKLCHSLLSVPTDHFYKVFSNVGYAVFRLHDMSVRYMPRCFDT